MTIETPSRQGPDATRDDEEHPHPTSLKKSASRGAAQRQLPGKSDGLGTTAARGAAVTLVGQGGRIFLQMASVVMLARILTPHDYGLMALVVVLVGIAEIFRDFGLSSAAVQAPHLSVNQRDNLFWVNTAIGASLSVIVFVGAPLYSYLFEQPALTQLTRTLAVSFFLNGLATQYRASLNRGLRFKSLAITDVTAQGFGLAVAIVSALMGAGYWALVAQQMSQAVLVLVLLVTYSKWIPSMPHRDTDLKPFLRFGWNLVSTQLVGYLANNTDSIIIGLRFGPGPLGVYNRAFQLLMNPLNQLRTPTSTVALPVLSRLQKDFDRAGNYIKRGQIALGYTIVPGLALGMGAAQPLVRLFLGDKWTQVAPVFALLAVAGSFQTLAFVGYWIYVSRGLTSDLLKYTLVSFTIRVTCVVTGSTWGIVGVAAGYAAAPAIAWPISFWWLSRKTVIPVRDLWTGGMRVVAMAGGAAAAAHLCSILTGPWPSVFSSLACAAAVLLVYGLGVALFARVRQDVLSVVDIGRKIVKRR